MQTDVLNNEPEILNVEPTPMVDIVNLNIGQEYHDTLGGKEYKFVPLKVYRIAEKQAEFLVIRAASGWEDQKHTAAEQKSAYLKLKGYSEPYKQEMRHNYAIEHEDGSYTTKTQPTKYPGLLRMDNGNTKKLYEEEISLYVKSRPSSGLVIQTSNKDEEQVPMPDPTWDKDKREAYILRYGPFKRPFRGGADPIKRVEVQKEQCLKSFEYYKNKLTEAGKEFVIVPSSKFIIKE